MTLLDMQRALSRLITDKNFRQAFRSGEPAAHRAYPLNARELDCLLGMQWERVGLHAEMVAVSRMRLGLKALPLSHLSLGDVVSELVDRFCAAYPPLPRTAGTATVEAERVCDFLTGLIDAGELTPAWVRDILAYERALLNVGSAYQSSESAARVARLAKPPSARSPDAVPVAGQHVALLSFDYPVPDLIASLEAAEVPAKVAQLSHPMWIILQQEADAATIRIIRVSEPTASLVGACDGRRTVAQVLAVLASRYGDDVRPGALSILDRMVELDIVGLTDPEG
jgi:hypothetical protein